MRVLVRCALVLCALVLCARRSSSCAWELCPGASDERGAQLRRLRLRGGSGQAHEAIQAVLARRAAVLGGGMQSAAGAVGCSTANGIVGPTARDGGRGASRRAGGVLETPVPPAAHGDQRDLSASRRAEAGGSGGSPHGAQHGPARGESRCDADRGKQRLRTWEERIDDILGPSSDDERVEKLSRARAALAVLIERAHAAVCRAPVTAPVRALPQRACPFPIMRARAFPPSNGGTTSSTDRSCGRTRCVLPRQWMAQPLRFLSGRVWMMRCEHGI